MAFRIAYLLTEAPLTDAVKALDLQIAEEVGDPPDGDVPLWATTLSHPNWTLVWAEDELFFFKRERACSTLSRRASLISCIVNETVMSSTAMGWRDGAEVWSLHHQGDTGDVFHLDIAGTPPAEFADLNAALEAKRSDGSAEPDHDYAFEVPVALAERLTGFRYDRAVDPNRRGAFRILEPRQAPSLLVRLFRSRS
ncbi:MAG: hypothetical protein AAGE18_05255 [Pseudomonadota bacterium]